MSSLPSRKNTLPTTLRGHKPLKVVFRKKNIVGFFVLAALTGCQTASMDKEDVRLIIKGNAKSLNGCYQDERKKRPKSQGKVVMAWTIGTDGRVIAARVKSSTIKSPELETCMVERIKTWEFPKPPGGSTAEISYPFVFMPDKTWRKSNEP